MAHLEAEAPHRERALAGLSRLVAHASYMQEGRQRIRLIADAEVHLAGGLFQQNAEQRMLNHAGVAELSLRLVNAGLAGVDDEDRAVIGRAVAHVAEREARFADDMRGLANSVGQAAAQFGLALTDAREQLLAHAASTDMLELGARTRVIHTARNLGVVVTQEEVKALSARVRRAFPVALAFLRQLALAALRGDMNWSRSDRANSVWDLNMAFHASRANTIEGVPALLVTNDQAIRAAADEVGHGAFVASLEEYRALLAARSLKERVAQMLRVAA